MNKTELKEIIKRRKKPFSAENPQKLIDLIEIEKKAIEVRDVGGKFIRGIACCIY